MRALEHYSKQPEGALYRFSWMFPRGTDGKTIGFGSRDEGPTPGETYAHLPEGRIDVKMRSPIREHPLLLFPVAERAELVQRAYAGREHRRRCAAGHLRGQLGQKNRQIFEALLTAYRGDLGTRARPRPGRAVHHLAPLPHRRRHHRPADGGRRQRAADHGRHVALGAARVAQLADAVRALRRAGRRLGRPDRVQRPAQAPARRLEVPAARHRDGRGLAGVLHLAHQRRDDGQLQRAAPQRVQGAPRLPLVPRSHPADQVPYLRDYRQEQAIYESQIATQVRVHVAPHAMYVAALWAVLSRLRRAESDRFAERHLGKIASDLTPLEKAELYADGITPKRVGADETLRLRNGIARDHGGGRSGPRVRGADGRLPARDAHLAARCRAASRLQLPVAAGGARVHHAAVQERRLRLPARGAIGRLPRSPVRSSSRCASAGSTGSMASSATPPASSKRRATRSCSTAT